MDSATGLMMRLDRIERENRRLRLAAGLGMGFILVALVAGQARAPSATPAVLEANGFILRGPRGEAAAQLTMGKGGPTLQFAGPNGKVVMEIGVMGPGPGLVLGDFEATAPSVELRPGRLQMMDKDGKTRLQCSASGKGALISLVDASGEPSVLFGDRTLVFLDKAKRTLAGLAVSDKLSGLTLSDPLGNTVTLSNVPVGGSVLVVTGATGKTVAPDPAGKGE